MLERTVIYYQHSRGIYALGTIVLSLNHAVGESNVGGGPRAFGPYELSPLTNLDTSDSTATAGGWHMVQLDLTLGVMRSWLQR